VCEPTAIIAGVSGGLNAIGSAQSVNAQNKANLANWENQVETRKRNWYQSLSIWGAKKNKYYQDLNDNDLAAQRGYSQAQEGLNKAYAEALRDNEESLIKFIKSSGKLTASGRTGRSIARLNNLEIAALEKEAGRRQYALTKSKEAYDANVENIRRQQKSARNQLFSNVAFAPIPDLPPPPPVQQNPNFALFLGLAGAGLDAWGAYESAKPQKVIIQNPKDG
jgi:hypothetical protein